MTQTSTRARKRMLPLVLIICLLACLLAPVGVQANAETGYSEMLRIYTLEGVDMDANIIAVGYLYGSASNAAKDNYAVVLKIHRNGAGAMDIMDGEKFNQLTERCLSVTQSSVSNINEYLLSLGIPDEFLFLNEKPYALLEIEKGLAAGQSTVNIKDAVAIMPDTLAYAARRGGADARLQLDSMYYSSVDVRITVNPNNVTKGIVCMAGVVENADYYTLAMFERLYTNRFAVVSFMQEGSFGTTVQVQAKMNLDGLNTNSLVFYSYNTIANSYQKLEDVTYSYDGTYLKFTTDVGGDILVTDRELVKR